MIKFMDMNQPNKLLLQIDIWVPDFWESTLAIN